RQIRRGAEGIPARDRSARHAIEGKRVLQHGQFVLSAAAIQGCGRRLQARPGHRSARHARQVESGNGAAQAAGRGKEEAPTAAKEGRAATAATAAATAAATTGAAAGAQAAAETGGCAGPERQAEAG